MKIFIYLYSYPLSSYAAGTSPETPRGEKVQCKLSFQLEIIANVLSSIRDELAVS